MLTPRRSSRTRFLTPWPALWLTLAACAAAPPRAHDPGDPTVLLRTRPEGELGVSTPYGVVFLGRGARSGEVEFEVHFNDGPSYEIGIVEPVGNGLYVTHAEIALPTVPLSYTVPEEGQEVRVRGRWPGGFHPDTLYELHLEVAADERIEGLLLATPPGELEALGTLPVGAGVFVEEEGETRLAGLVTGSLTLDDEGIRREFLTVAGPDRLWRLVTHGRSPDRRRRWVNRRDILP